jgi:hypothetical protein
MFLWEDNDNEQDFDYKANPPSGASNWHCSYYKIGVHGKVFIFINDRWMLSTINKSEVERFRKC